MGNELLSKNDASGAIDYYVKSETNEGWFNIGHVYWHGHPRSSPPLHPDPDKAVENFRRAADNGDLDSKYFLGVNLEDLSLVAESAEGGHGGAMHYMALHNYSETGSEGRFKEEVRECEERKTRVGKEGVAHEVGTMSHEYSQRFVASFLAAPLRMEVPETDVDVP